MESKPNVGRLERVNLRQIWGDEARNFTPWLASAEGLSLLADLIGYELELIGTEQPVGPFSADILAKKASDEDHKVIIENQLGKTDHDHLGKAITYAAGLGAKTLIWISDRFCEEHREALDWLNHNTGGSLAFWGLEVRAFRIGESLPAPQFNAISRPNATTKAIREDVESAERPSSDELHRIAAARHSETLVNRLLELERTSDVVWSTPSKAYDGSFRCWRRDPQGKPRMVMGINVSGKRKQTPDGQLDIWLPLEAIATVTETSSDEVRNVLESFPIFVKEVVDWLARLKNEQEAETVFETLSSFFEKHPGYGEPPE